MNSKYLVLDLIDIMIPLKTFKNVMNYLLTLIKKKSKKTKTVTSSLIPANVSQ